MTAPRGKTGYRRVKVLRDITGCGWPPRKTRVPDVIPLAGGTVPLYTNLLICNGTPLWGQGLDPGTGPVTSRLNEPVLHEPVPMPPHYFTFGDQAHAEDN